MTQQMSKLNSGKIKITNDGNIIMQFSNQHHVIDSDTELYYKHQADKVIAEKDEKIGEFEERIDELQKATDSAWSKVNAMYNKLRHHKYKRCLANAWWCRNLSKTYAWSAYNHRGWKIDRYYDEKAELYRKCRKRWLELAEKFKEAK